MQKDQEFGSEDDEKITVARFACGGPIDLGLDSVDKMKIATLGVAVHGLVDLGPNSENETNILVDIVLNIKMAPYVPLVQEL